MNDFDDLFSQMIDDYVGVEPSPTEKQRKWREVTRYTPVPFTLFVSIFFSCFSSDSFRL